MTGVLHRAALPGGPAARWRLAVLLSLTAALLVGCPGARSQAAPAPARDPRAVSLQVVAHPDDDLLFLNPDVLADVAAGRVVRTVYVTSGDDNDVASYWQSREDGVEAAYAAMAGVPDRWTGSDAGISGHRVTVRTLVARPAVSLVFLRLPDGQVDGSGGSRYSGASLLKLYQGTITSVPAIDGTSQYSLAELTSVLTQLVRQVRPTVLRTQDWSGGFGDGDHTDHHVVGRLVRTALQASGVQARLVGYLGYPATALPVNVVEPDLTAKTNAFLTYAGFDSRECQTRSSCAGRYEGAWLARQHLVGETGGTAPPGTDLALKATATASGQNTATGQTADKAVDGVVGGYPAAPTAEWATSGGGAGSWLTLRWPSPVTLGWVQLFDRPNTQDRVTSATLTFSDGSTVPVAALPDAGPGGLLVSFPPRSTTSLTVTVTGVSATTASVGLAEVQAG